MANVYDFNGSIYSLYESLNDREMNVNTAVIKTLTKIATRRPNEVLLVFLEFYKNNRNLYNLHVINIIDVVEQTCLCQVKELKLELVKAVADTTMVIMLDENQDCPDIQLGASSVLIALAHMHLDLIFDKLTNELTPKSIPHYTIPHTLGTLAAMNTLGVVPKIKDVLNVMLPILTFIKTDIIKQAFSYVFGNFATAISEQISEYIENGNISNIKDNFVTEFSFIFDVLFHQWLNSSEGKVTESVLESLGPITRLITGKKFDDIINKLFLTLLPLYKKQNINAHNITQCLSYLLTPTTLNPKLSLTENVINNTIQTLFRQVLLEPDYDQPNSVKNHFETLRCFDYLADQFPDFTMDLLLQNCKNSQEKERMKAVIVLTHLTTSSQIFINNYLQKYIAILKLMLVQEQSVRIKKVLVKSLVGLVYRNCLHNDEDYKMIEFIVKHCNCDGGSQTGGDIRDLKDTCNDSLFLLCSTIVNARQHLYNLLVSCIENDELTHSLSSITFCLSYILKNKSEVIIINNVERISNERIFVRCFIFLIDNTYIDRNKNIISFLNEYATNIHKNLNGSWQVELQRLKKFVNSNDTPDQWHKMLIDLLISAVDIVNDINWTKTVTTILSEELISNKYHNQLKGISLQYLAALICNISDNTCTEKMLYILLTSIKTMSLECFQYIDYAIGIASRKHGNYAMNYLDNLYKDIERRRGSALLNFISTKHAKNESDLNTIKYVIILCYGQIAEQCLDIEILDKLCNETVPLISELLKTNQSFQLNEASLKTVYHIVKAVQPAPHHNIVLRNRWPLLKIVLEQLFNTNYNSRNIFLFPLIVNTSKELFKLQKNCPPEERNTILRLLTQSIFEELSVLKKKFNEDSANDDETYKLAKRLNDSVSLLHELVCEFAIAAPCLSMLDDVLSLLINYLYHINCDVRLAAAQLITVVLQTFIKNVRLNFETPSKFGQMGFFIGMILPGCYDGYIAVRSSAIDNIKLIIQIQDLYEGRTAEAEDEWPLQLEIIHDEISCDDLDNVRGYSETIGDILCSKVPQYQFMQFVETVMERFDSDNIKSEGIVTVVNAIFKNKGLELYHSIERIMEIFISKMDNVDKHIGYKVLNCITSLAHHHSNTVTAVLLAQSIPFKESVRSIWIQLTKHNELAEPIVEYLIRLMTSIQLFEDPYNITENHIAALQPLTAISGLKEMLSVDTTGNIWIKHFADIYAILYTTLASYHDALAPAYSIPTQCKQERFGYIPNRDSIKLSPALITLEAFCLFLKCTHCEKASTMWEEAGAECWESSECGAAVWCGATSSRAISVCNVLLQYVKLDASHVSRPQRAAAHAALAHLLRYAPLDASAVESVECILCNAASRCAAACRGVSAVPNMSRALKALSNALESPHTNSNNSENENIPLAAIQSLCYLLSNVKELTSECEREVDCIMHKIKVFMNTEDVQLREFSIRLFGTLASRTKSNVLEHSLNILPCLLLRLCDDCESVVKACKFTLKCVFNRLPCTKCNKMIQQHLVDSGRLYLEAFLTDLIHLWVEEMPQYAYQLAEYTITFLNSEHNQIRANAAHILGALYGDLSKVKEHDENIDVEKNIVLRLNQMLKDRNAEVRKSAATALANFCLRMK